MRQEKTKTKVKRKSVTGNKLKSKRHSRITYDSSTSAYSGISKMPKIYMTEIDKTSSDKQKVFNDLTKKGIVKDRPDDINIGLADERGREMIVNSKLEKKRMIVRKFDNICIVLMLSAVFIIAASAAIDVFLKSKAADTFLLNTNRSAYISESGDYIFGSFENYVTIGDTLEYAFDILGFPDFYIKESGQFFYGDSYIIVENDKVVGYYKDGKEEFHVTVGYKDEGISNAIGIGDSAGRVVKKLGSPDIYLKQKWIYKNYNERFEKNIYDSSEKNLIVIFDDDYTVSAYEFTE